MIKNAVEFITRWSQEVVSEETPISEDLEESQRIISEEVFKATNDGARFAWATGNSFIRLPKPYGVKVGNAVKISAGSSGATQVLNFPFSWHDFWYLVIQMGRE
jgi:hypothetical protein